MPAIVGPIELHSLDSSSIFTVGDSFSLSPKSEGKLSIGAGGANTGDFIDTKNYFAISNFHDRDEVDQATTLNK